MCPVNGRRHYRSNNFALAVPVSETPCLVFVFVICIVRVAPPAKGVSLC